MLWFAFCLHNVGICNFNPVKHGLVKRVCDYEFSSFHRDVKRGLFAPDWGSLIDDEIINHIMNNICVIFGGQGCPPYDTIF